ncbi:MAG: hypothetical protein LUG24_10735 [Clostridiales bacterium]|nr:hypothetical protein [Clostridiales bacterium]
MKYSKYIDDFLTFLRDSRQDYNIAVAEEENTNNEILDIEHSLELDIHTYHEYAKLSKAIKAVKVRRRKAKDTRLALQHVVDWTEVNQPAIKSLERLLGVLRKEEERTENRYYNPRTEILREILGEKSTESEE